MRGSLTYSVHESCLLGRLLCGSSMLIPGGQSLPNDLRQRPPSIPFAYGLAEPTCLPDDRRFDVMQDPVLIYPCIGSISDPAPPKHDNSPTP